MVLKGAEKVKTKKKTGYRRPADRGQSLRDQQKNGRNAGRVARRSHPTSPAGYVTAAFAFHFIASEGWWRRGESNPCPILRIQ
jgi:hypothetical protein